MTKTSFVSLLLLVTTLLGSCPIPSHAQTEVPPPSIQNVRALLEIQYDLNGGYTKACKEKTIKEALKKEKYTCRSSKDSYVVYKKISSKNYSCIDSTGFVGTVAKKPKTSKKPYTCGAETEKPFWQLTTAEKLAIPLKDRHDWSDSLGHKYRQQVFWELRGESYSWKYDLNNGSYLGVCKHKSLGSAYIEMMKEDGLKNIECGDSPSWFYIKATLPDNSSFCLNRNDADGNDTEEDMRDCSEAAKTKFKNIVVVD
jgi:hypothetical protein